MQLGILDFGFWSSPSTRNAIVAETIRSAVLADQLGFQRYWLGEHHAPGVAWDRPDMIIDEVATATSRIRVGSGGILLSGRDLCLTTRDFLSLSVKFANRIDFGVARGSSLSESKLRTEYAEGVQSMDYRTQIETVLYHLTKQCGHYAKAEDECIKKSIEKVLPVWILGSGTLSMNLAAALGLPFVYSTFHSGTENLSIVNDYRDRFHPSVWLEEPECMVAVAGTCAETYREASAIVSQHFGEHIKPTVWGSYSECSEQLRNISIECAVSEILFFDISRTEMQRRRSYTLLSQSIE